MMLRAIALAAFAVLSTTGSAAAQQSFHNVSAAQPGRDVRLGRVVFQYFEMDDDAFGRDVNVFMLEPQLAYGLTGSTALIGRLPIFYEDAGGGAFAGDDEAFGLGDAHVMLKQRVWRRDSGPLDTMRLSLLAGLDVPTGTDGFGNDGWDPMLGAVFTSIRGRHGANAAGRYKFNTDERDDAVFTMPGESLADIAYLDLSYLYRVAPAKFTAGSHGAWYAMLDVNGTYETNGDAEVLLGPGLMYEARRWVFEVSVQAPAYAEVDHRTETALTVGLGFRLLF